MSFYLPDIIFDLPEISYRKACIVYHGFKDLKTIFFSVLLHFIFLHISGHGLSQYLETGCPNRGFIDFCVSKVWYKVHTINKINPIYLQIFLF